jgi:hypothetical protein
VTLVARQCCSNAVGVSTAEEVQVKDTAHQHDVEA